MAIAPALTMGFVRPEGARSTAEAELNGSPVGLTPTRRRTASTPSASQTSANTNGLETLIKVNAASASPTACTAPSTVATASPNRAGSACASTGYTSDSRPSALPPYSACARSSSRATTSSTGRLPVET